MEIRAVIFDFGGVLMRTEDRGGREKWEERLGLPRLGLEKIVFGSDVAARGMLGQTSQEDAWEHLAETFRLGPVEMEELRHDFWSGDRLDTELVEFLRGLRPRYKTAILSNAWGNARALFGQLGLDEVSDVMVISAEEGIKKPDPRIYHLTLDRLKVQPEEAVLVDDFIENIAGARAVGMRAVHFQSPDQALAEVRIVMSNE